MLFYYFFYIFFLSSFRSFLLSEIGNPASSIKPTSKFMLAVDVVKRYMQNFGFGLFDGAMYKKAPEAVYTFIYCCTVKNFLLHILGNVEVADQIATFITPISSLLSERSCRAIKPIKLDFNYIEVLPEGFCFNIKEKRFERRPCDLNGSPRAFVKYICNGKVPYPKPFVEGNPYCRTFVSLMVLNNVISCKDC